MRLRITTPHRTLHDLKIPKNDRERMTKAIEQIERRRAEWEYDQIALSVGEVDFSGMLESIERKQENGEMIIVFRFLEN